MTEIEHGIINEVGGMTIRHHKTGIPYGYMEGRWEDIWGPDWFNMTRGNGRLLIARPHRYISNSKNKYANVQKGFMR